MDNLMVDKDGAVWAAGMRRSILTHHSPNNALSFCLLGLPNAMHLVNVHFADPSIKTPSSALKITLNQGQSQYYGEKYKVDKVRCLWLSREPTD